MIKTVILMIMLGMPFASINTAGLTLQETPAKEYAAPESPEEYLAEETGEEAPEEYLQEETSGEAPEDAPTMEEMYQLNYDSYEDEESEDWYDVPIESCPGHEYISANAYDGERYFVSHYCPYCGDYYETPLTEQEYDAGTVDTETEEPPDEEVDMEADETVDIAEGE